MRPPIRWLKIILPAALLLLSAVSSECGERPAWTSSRFVGTPDPPAPYRAELAYPALTFRNPLDLAVLPHRQRIFVLEQAGKVHSFEDREDVATHELALDLKNVNPRVSAAYAIAFHPDVQNNGRVFLCYILGNEEPDGTVVSEFQLSRSDPPTIDPSSERVIIRWLSGGHNGCCLKFGHDGYLYISTGDGGAPDPPDPLGVGQDVTNLLSAILRIDVDAGASGQGDEEGEEEVLAYRIPDDNPLTSYADARPEIFAYGFRNPWRMSVDPQTGRLWVGDVGWQLWEMIYLVEPGGNYGWPIVEGPQSVLPHAKQGPTPIRPPVVSHPHSEAASITGGYVYRGSRLAELRGAYVYGDFQSGRVWALRHDGTQVTWKQEIAQTPLTLVSFGEDTHGDLLLLDYQRSQQIYRLTRSQPTDPQLGQFPKRLSETGLFQDVARQVPATGVQPYQVNAAKWSDGTVAERWFAVPGTEPLAIDRAGNVQFPEGSVLVKTVSAPQHSPTEEVPPRKRLETQILHRYESSWRAYSYVWTAEQDDAVLADASGSSSGADSYRIASRAECQMCHNPWVDSTTTMFGVQSASPLAIGLDQLHHAARPIDGGTGGEDSTSQLVALQQAGWLEPDAVTRAATITPLVSPDDQTADLDARARSYLHVNCAHCHQPNAGGTATIDLRYHVPLDNAQLVSVQPKQGNFQIPDAQLVAPGQPHRSVLLYRMAKSGAGRMPRLGAALVDPLAVPVISRWIEELGPADTRDAETQELRRTLAEYCDERNDKPPVDAQAIKQQFASSLQATDQALRMAVAVSDDGVAHGVKVAIAQAARTADPLVRDLFERFLPASERPKRLGSVFDPTEILMSAGDVEQGRELFFRNTALACSQCHRVLGLGEAVGPDLSQIGTKYTREELLAQLIEPSRRIDPPYQTYRAETTDGRTFVGLLQTQSADEVVLRTAQNQDMTVRREQIEALELQSVSLMPDRLLSELTAQEAADLLAFLQSLRSGP